MSAQTRAGVLYALLTAVGYAFFPVFIAYIYAASAFQPIDIAVWRFVLAVPMIWLLLLARARTNPNIRERLPRLRLMGLGVLLALGALAAFYSLRAIDASLFVILFRTYPVLVFVVSIMLGASVPQRGWLALAVVLIGVVLMVYQPDEIAVQLTAAYWVGVLAAFANALVIAFYNVGQERIMRPYRSRLKAAAWTLTGSLIVLLGAALFTGVKPPPNLTTIGSLVGIAALCTVMPTFAIYEGIARLGASRFVIIGSVEPLLAIVMAMLLLGEEMLTPLQLVGGALVLFSIFILEYRTGQRRQTREVRVAGD